MKTLKVTYKTDASHIFKTIIPFVTDVNAFMGWQYSNVEVLKVRPSIKQGYKHFCNIEVK